MVKSSSALSRLDQLVNDLQRELRDRLPYPLDPEELDDLTVDVLRSMFDDVGNTYVNEEVSFNSPLGEDDLDDEFEPEPEDEEDFLDMYPSYL